MVIGSAIVIVYTMLGGFITVVATDSFQAVLMVVTCVVLTIAALFIGASHNMGIAEAFLNADFTVPLNVETSASATGFLLILNGLSWASGYTGQPQLLTRMMAMRNPAETRQALWLAVGWTLLAYGGAFMTGIIGFHMAEVGLLGANAAKAALDAEKIRITIPSGISERLASYLLAFLAAIAFSLLYHEKTKTGKQ